MKPLEMIWRPLVERRLLPVAIVLVAALAAVPLLLKKDPAPAPRAAAPAADSVADNPATEKPVVSLVADGERDKRRRVLGSRKNPFEPAAAVPTATPTPTAQTQTQSTVGASTGGTTTVNGGSLGGGPAPSTGGTTTTPPASSPPVPTAPKPKYELYSLTVRFGSTDEDALPKLNLPRLKALPDADDPLLVYLGPTKNGKSAIFMVDSNVEPQGDGSCNPSPANCETIRLSPGDTEFFDVKDAAGTTTAQFQLDLVKIKHSTTASAAKAQAARAKVSKAGRAVVRVRKAEKGPLRWNYDAKTGTLRKLGPKAYRAAVARTARYFDFAGGF